MGAKVAVFLDKIIVFLKVLSTFAFLYDFFLQNNTIFMYLDPEKKQEIFGKYGKSNTDTGSAESQVALFSYRISHLTEHLKSNHKDYSTSRSLKMLVGKRRRLLDYLKEKDIEKYRSLIKELGIRR
jgi:small subunit ribosomal protein S15